MSKDKSGDKPDYETGYGKPPKVHRFRKGQSGNPKGRPKQSTAVTVDVEKLMTEPVTATQDGVARTMSRKEVELRRILQKAVKGDLRAIANLLDQFGKHGAMVPPATENGGGVAILPSNIPFPLAMMVAERFGEPPWSDAQIDVMWPLYDETRTEEVRETDREFYGR
jgi:hypothetical protein